MDLTPALRRDVLARRGRAWPGENCLVGSECANCGQRAWPGRSICQRCGSPDVRDVALSQRGVLVAQTIVHVPLRGIPAPYVVGRVRLDDGVSLFANVRSLGKAAPPPWPVRIVLAGEPDSEPAFWFEPL